MSEWRDAAVTAASYAGRGALAKVGAIAVVVFVALLLFLAPFAGGTGAAAADPCVDPGAQLVDDPRVPQADEDQLSIARTANDVAVQMNMPGRAVLVIYMTGLQESGMRNLDYGDRDSLGWLQQRPSQGWGTAEQVRDIAYSSRSFYEHLRAVPNWTQLSLNDAAQAVQRSGYPDAYAKHESRARAIAAAVGADLERQGDPTGTGTPVPVDAPLPVACDLSGLAPGAWVQPIPGFTTFWDNYGEVSSIRGGRTHTGEDLAAPDGWPILAASDGVVTDAGCTATWGCSIRISHAPDDGGRTIQTVYIHMWPHGVLVEAGQAVTAGQRIGLVGSSGNSTGPHLHYEVRIAGVPVDPQQFMAGVGIDLADPRAQSAGGSSATPSPTASA